MQPAVRWHLLVSFVLALALLASTALGRATYELLAPLYMLSTGALVVSFGWIEGSRLRSFLKASFPDEYRKLVPTGNELGYNSLRGLRFAFRNKESDAPLLAEARRRARLVCGESLFLMFTMIVVTEVGDALVA